MKNVFYCMFVHVVPGFFRTGLASFGIASLSMD